MDNIKFPVRNRRSLEDNLLLKAQKMAQGNAEIRIMASWDDMFSSRPFDSAMYTALNDRACILLYFSSTVIENNNWITQVISKSDSMELHLGAFVQGRYPLLRSNYFFPREIGQRIILESPLDIRDGHVQDFCKAILANPTVDVIVKHQLNDAGYYHGAFYAPELPRILQKDLQKALANFETTLTQNDFNESYRLMTQVFPSSDSDIKTANLVTLQRVGSAKNQLVQKEFSADGVNNDASEGIEFIASISSAINQESDAAVVEENSSDMNNTQQESFSVRTFDIDLSDSHVTGISRLLEAIKTLDPALKTIATESLPTFQGRDITQSVDTIMELETEEDQFKVIEIFILINSSIVLEIIKGCITKDTKSDFRNRVTIASMAISEKASWEVFFSGLDETMRSTLTELAHIYRTFGYWNDDGDKAFNERGYNIRVRAIGIELDELGGMTLMQQIHALVGKEIDYSAASTLESAWRNIGNWR